MGIVAVKHQRFVGTGYFDQVQQVISGGLASTVALKESTEAEQFSAAATPPVTLQNRSQQLRRRSLFQICPRKKCCNRQETRIVWCCVRRDVAQTFMWMPVSAPASTTQDRQTTGQVRALPSSGFQYPIVPGKWTR